MNNFDWLLRGPIGDFEADLNDKEPASWEVSQCKSPDGRTTRRLGPREAVKQGSVTWVGGGEETGEVWREDRLSEGRLIVVSHCRSRLGP